MCVLTMMWGRPCTPAFNLALYPYPDINNSGKREFSYKLISCGMVMECAFGRQSQRAFRLCAGLDVSVAKAVRIIITGCTPHKLCVGKEEYFCPEWAQNRSGLQRLYRQSDPHQMHTGPGSRRAGEVWDVICTHLGTAGRQRVTSACAKGRRHTLCCCWKSTCWNTDTYFWGYIALRGFWSRGADSHLPFIPVTFHSLEKIIPGCLHKVNT